MAEAEAKYDILTHIVVGGDVWVGLHRVGGRGADGAGLGHLADCQEGG